jgi:nucleotide-binding universal stress UspA family protein
MGLLLRPRPRPVPRKTGFQRILVPVDDDGHPTAAVALACKLAAERGAEVRIVTVVEVPGMLPLDARMDAEELAAHDLLERSRCAAERYGVSVTTEILRGRDAAQAIAEQAGRGDNDLVVIGAASHPRGARSSHVLGRTATHVLREAACRVMLVRS